MKTRLLIRAAMMAAVVAALGLVPPLYLPISPVAITAQTLGVMLAGCVLGARGGFLSLLVFVLLLVMGVPVLAGGRGGFGLLMGPSAGYILAFPLAALLIGYLVERTRRLTFWKLFAYNVLGGIVLVYLIGAPVLALLTGRSFAEAFVAGAVLYVPGDLIKAAVAAATAMALYRAVGEETLRGR